MIDPVLDPKALERLRRIGGDGLLKAMMTSFLEYGPERIADARAAVAANDAKALSEAGHALKSSAGNIGATSLQIAAQKVERDALLADASLAALADELVAAFEDARSAAASARDASPADG